MYENSKINTVKKASNDIVGSIEEDNLTDMMYRVSAENDLCIRIYSENSSIYAGNMGCVLYRMSDVELVKEISKARQNNNTYLSTKAESFDGSKDSIIKDITYTRIVDDNDSTYIVMVNTSITPVDATVSNKSTMDYFGICFNCCRDISACDKSQYCCTINDFK